VLDGIGVIRANLFKELLKVVRGRPCLAPAAARVLCCMLRARAACQLVDTAVIIDSCLLVVLFAPILAALSGLLSI
jgi:hypothetical protein